MSARLGLIIPLCLILVLLAFGLYRGDSVGGGGDGISPPPSSNYSPNSVPPEALRGVKELGELRSKVSVGLERVNGKQEVHQATVRVLDSSGEPVSGARVFVVSGSVEEEFDETDSYGVSTIPERVFVDRIVASKKGFTLGEVWTTEIENEYEYSINLKASSRISGRVVAGTGELGACGEVTVFAQPWSMGLVHLEPTNAKMASRQSPCLLTCSTDPDGYFVIEGVDPSLTYRISAFKLGWMCTSFINDVYPRSADVLIEVERVFALQFKFEAEGRKDPIPLVDLRKPGSRRIAVRLEPPNQETVKLGDEIGPLVGLPPIPEGYTRFLFSQHGAVGPIGPFRCSGSPVGYQAFTEELWAKPVLKQNEVATVHLTPTGPLGEISILVSQYPGDIQLADGRTNAGLLHLHPVSGGLELNIELSFSHLRGDTSISGLPAGSYEVYFVPLGGQASAAEKEETHLEIRPGSTQELSLDFSPYSLVEVEVLSANGHPDTRPFVLQIEKPQRTEASGKTGFAVLGSVRSKWKSSRDRIHVLLLAGEYQLRPLNGVMGISPIVDSNLSGHLTGVIPITAISGERSAVILMRTSVD